MKLSNYAWIVRHENTHILYKCHHETLVAIEEPLKELLERGDWEALEEMHPTFFAYLVERGFLLEDHVDESREVIAEWEREDANRSVYNIIINPTMDCNMRCWYCYEKHEKGSVMSDEMVETVLRFIEKKVQSSELKQLNLNFFGGEPLLYYKRRIVPILEQTILLCKESDTELNVSFTTNGYLLTEKLLHSLREYSGIKIISFQIAIDGNKELHDKTKFLAGKTETYAQIMNNVKTAVGLHLPITLRCNCTMKNIFSFIDVAKELGLLSDEEKKYILIDLQPVWQEQKNDLPEFHEGLESLRQSLKKEKLHVRNDKVIDFSRCYADKDNGLVINYNGDIYSCTARDFIKDNKEGIITPQGEIVWNDRKEYRISLKYGNDTCRKCTIYPICHGKCTQYKMETGLNVGCICNYTDGKKKEIIESRISFLINNQLKN